MKNESRDGVTDSLVPALDPTDATSDWAVLQGNTQKVPVQPSGLCALVQRHSAFFCSQSGGRAIVTGC